MEYMNLPNMQPIINRLAGGDLATYWPAVQAKRTSPNGVFGFKSFVQNYQHIARTHPELLDQISSDKVIALVRRDKLAQAVSYARAAQTKVWFAGFPEPAPEYSHKGIRNALKWISDQESSWEVLYQRTDTQPLRLDYEDVRNDFPAALVKIADFIGVDVKDAAPVDIPLIEKQADAISQEWIERFREESADSDLELA